MQGDIVYLRSGGPAMTVMEWYRCEDCSDMHARCQWFEDGKLMEATFETHALSSTKFVEPVPPLTFTYEYPMTPITPYTTGTNITWTGPPDSRLN